MIIYININLLTGVAMGKNSMFNPIFTLAVNIE